MILKARGPGKFCSKRLNGVKVGKIRPNFWKSAIWWEISQFFGPCRGLTHLERCIRPLRQGGKRKSVSWSFYYSEGNFLLLEKSWLLIVVILFQRQSIEWSRFFRRYTLEWASSDSCPLFRHGCFENIQGLWMIGMVKADAFQTSIAHVIEREAFINVLMASVHIVVFVVKCCRDEDVCFRLWGWHSYLYFFFRTLLGCVFLFLRLICCCFSFFRECAGHIDLPVFWWLLFMERLQHGRCVNLMCKTTIRFGMRSE